MDKLFDYELYLKLYPDLNENGIKTQHQALHHWLNYGCKEDRINNKLKLIEKDNFNYIFYINNYEDLRANNIYTEIKALNHWVNYGRKQGRICDKLINNNNIANDQLSYLNFNKINILLRNTYRPNSFKKCIDSIIKQNYPNIQIICCYDDKRCEEYLDNYNYDYLYKFFINIDLKDYPELKKNDKPDYTIFNNNELIECYYNDPHYKYNLYCNILLDKVENGWFLFLDDDDLFIDNNSLFKINNLIKSKSDIILWKFKSNLKSVYPKNIYDIKPTQIASCTYCIHSKYKNSGKWTSHQLGDYDFINEVLSKINFNRKFIPEELTGTGYNNKNIGNLGKKEN